LSLQTKIVKAMLHIHTVNKVSSRALCHSSAF
jgi:hypothetical protein